MRESDIVDVAEGVREAELPKEIEAVGELVIVVVGVPVGLPVPVREGVGVGVEEALMPSSMYRSACACAMFVTASFFVRKEPSACTALGCEMPAGAVEMPMPTPLCRSLATFVPPPRALARA